MQSFSRFLISATSSGSGKTTLSLGLLRALQRRSLLVQPFKCGPDYIDTKYHDLAAGNPSVNLDTFLASKEHVRQIFAKHSWGKNVSVIEGVMGLFDGYDGMQGSSAEIAELLHVPVILIINAKAMAHSAAALLYGFKNYYPGARVVGAIFNMVNTESHYEYLKKACLEVGVEPLGYLPPNKEIEIPSRHLGLTLDSDYRFNEFADKVALLIEKYIDIDRLLELTAGVCPEWKEPEREATEGVLKISVARDEAFNFIYHENIEALKLLGDVTFFSPMADKCLPDSDFVYFPGGYPELYLNELSGNESMKNSIRWYAEQGGKILAECGGMMYLSDSISDKEGVSYPMVGVFSQRATMENMKLTLGYRYFEYEGVSVKGHEFHYSCLLSDAELPSQTTIYNATNHPVKTKLFRYKNTIAGYTHIYWPEIDLLQLFE